MTYMVNVHEAKTHLSKLLQQAVYVLHLGARAVGYSALPRALNNSREASLLWGHGVNYGAHLTKHLVIYHIGGCFRQTAHAGEFG